MRQRGFAFLPLLLANWQAIAIGLLVLSVYAYYRHCESVKADYAAFVSRTKAAGEEQERRVKAAIEQGKKDKEKADNENSRLRTSNAALARSLRDARAASGFLPAPAASAKRPEIAAFDRTLLERALQRLDEDVSGIVAEGDQARIDLDTAKVWAR